MKGGCLWGLWRRSLNSNEVSINEGRVSVGSVEAVPVGSVAKPANRIEGWGGLDVGVGSVAKPSNRIEGWGGLNVGSVGSAPVVSTGSVGSTPEESLGIVGSIAALLSSCEGSAPSASVVS